MSERERLIAAALSVRGVRRVRVAVATDGLSHYHAELAISGRSDFEAPEVLRAVAAMERIARVTVRVVGVMGEL